MGGGGGIEIRCTFLGSSLNGNPTICGLYWGPLYHRKPPEGRVLSEVFPALGSSDYH